MQHTAIRPLWAGRIAALLGILLIAVNLRTAVVAISPIVDLVSADIPLSGISLGMLGALPPIAFATSGLVAPIVARRIGVETTLVLACVAMIVGPVVRALSPNYLVLVLGTVIALAGMGFGNIMLPPAVKRYFPDRIGQVTAAYATLLALSTAVPAAIAAPVAGIAGWRISVSVWALFALTALIPWLVVRSQHRAALAADSALVAEVQPEMLGRMWHSRVAWALGLAFAVSSLSAYAFFAWLPEILVDRAGTTVVQAGALLALFGIVGLPAALFIPGIVQRLHNVGWLVMLGVGLFVVGFLGLLLVPTTATWLWVVCVGAGPLLFPMCLTLINLRTRTPAASVALSGFVQSVGYGAGAFGPLLVGILHEATGDWTAPLVFLLGFSLLGIIPAIVLSRRVFVEDELAARTAGG